MNFKSKPVILVSVIVAVSIAAAGFWYWSQKRAEISETPAAVKDGLGAKAFKKTNNPLSNEIPETNPFHINTNPFK